MEVVLRQLSILELLEVKQLNSNRTVFLLCRNIPRLLILKPIKFLMFRQVLDVNFS